MSKSSGYQGWVPQDDGKEVNSRTESREDGGTNEHHLWNNSGDSAGRANHEHVLIKEDSEGKIISAHTFGPKEERERLDKITDSYSSSSSGK